MILQSPESAMPEPYKTYVRQRSEAIATVLETIVGETDVQLCPRAIVPSERVFSDTRSHVYGTVVKKLCHGYKSVLYSSSFSGSGLATSSPVEGSTYVQEQLELGNRIRVKDPRESDGQGQHTVGSVSHFLSVFDEVTDGSEFGCVLMPHLDVITNRLSIGRMMLKDIGDFSYVGREQTVRQNGNEVYGGTVLGLFHSSADTNKKLVSQHFEISPELVGYGETALDAYSRLALFCGRVSVDVVEGYTDNGTLLREVIDITPRIGGATPAEILALEEIYKDTDAVCFSSSRLIYDPPFSPTTWINFIDTNTLVINAQVHEVRQ